jgi:hypothetical protein
LRKINASMLRRGNIAAPASTRMTAARLVIAPVARPPRPARAPDVDDREAAAFAVGSSAALMVAQGAWSRLRRTGTRLASWSVRLAGALLAGASAFALWNGLGAAIWSAVGG